MYTVALQVKPYVKKFLENKFGNPVCFPIDGVNRGSHYYNILQRMLMKPSSRYNNDRSGINYADNSSLVTMRVQISAYLFYGYGWELSPTDQMAFNSFVEGIIKELLCYCVSMSVNYENKIVSGINNFREITGITEDDFSHDTAKQYLYRVGFRKKKNFRNVTNFLKNDRQYNQESQI